MLKDIVQGFNLSRFSRRLAITLALVLTAIFQSSLSLASETWAEKLGYPADKPVVILHATQMGFSYETNAAGASFLQSNLKGSASIMAPCPWSNDFAVWNIKNPKHDVGVALTLTSKGQNYRWRPLSARTMVPQLVDREGFFWRTLLQSAVNGSESQVDQEIRAQIDWALSKGLKPSHLLPHRGVLFARADYAAAYMRAARDYWIPAVVIELTPEIADRFRKKGIPLQDEMIELVADYPLPKLDDVQFVPIGKSYEDVLEQFQKTVKDLKPGITQIMFRPAIETNAFKRIAPDWQQRVWEEKLLADPKMAQLLKERGVILTNWKEMMRRFEGKPELHEKETAEESKRPLKGTIGKPANSPAKN